jgi:two-component system phosphate regulon response regulator PhoB
MKKQSEIERVLVVEDDNMISKLLSIVLEHQGYEVQIADDYAAATSALEGSNPSIILLDLMLPDGNGLDLLRWLRDDLHRSVPVVVLTAFRQEDKALRAFELGANDFISKPFRPRELVARVQRVLAA